jgi:hypothetical protein
MSDSNRSYAAALGILAIFIAVAILAAALAP